MTETEEENDLPSEQVSGGKNMQHQVQQKSGGRKRESETKTEDIHALPAKQQHKEPSNVEQNDSQSEHSNQVSEHMHQQVQQKSAGQKREGQTKTEENPFEEENDSPSERDNQESGGKHMCQQVQQKSGGQKRESAWESVIITETEEHPYEDENESPSEQGNQESGGKQMCQQVQQKSAGQKREGQTKTEENPFEEENDLASEQGNQLSGGKQMCQQVQQKPGLQKRESAWESIIITKKETIQCAQIQHQHQSKPAFAIQSIYRREKGDGDGNLLEAETGEDSTEHYRTVAFKGTDPAKAETIFYWKSHKDDVFTLHCKLEKHKYYLCAEEEKVHLQKWTSESNPDEKKFLFQVVPVSHDFKTIASLGTGRYLQSDKKGNATMTIVESQVDGKCENRKAWFEVMDEKIEQFQESTTTLTQTQQTVTYEARSN